MPNLGSMRVFVHSTDWYPKRAHQFSHLHSEASGFGMYMKLFLSEPLNLGALASASNIKMEKLESVVECVCSL